MCISCTIQASPSVHDPQDQNSTALDHIFQILSSWVSHPKSTIFLCHPNSTLSGSYPRCMECHIPHCSNRTVCLRLAPVPGMRPACPSPFQTTWCCRISL